MIAEVVGGVLSNSLAIATDAAHLLTDFASFMISLFAIWVAGRPSSQRMSFGWHRAEVLGAMVSVLMIWVVTGVLVYMAVLRVISMEFEIDAKVMLITSGLGVLVNIIMGASLHQHGHSHGGGGGGADAEHGHGHSHGGGEENINVKAAFIHVIGDFLQSLGEIRFITIVSSEGIAIMYHCIRSVHCGNCDLLQARLGNCGPDLHLCVQPPGAGDHRDHPEEHPGRHHGGRAPRHQLLQRQEHAADSAGDTGRA